MASPIPTARATASTFCRHPLGTRSHVRLVCQARRHEDGRRQEDDEEGNARGGGSGATRRHGGG